METEQACSHCGDVISSSSNDADAYCSRVCASASACRIERNLSQCEHKFVRYVWERELAKSDGQYGVIYLVYNSVRRHESVLKVQAYVETFRTSHERVDREMLIACRVSGRLGFLRLYDYWICDVKPHDSVFRKAAQKRHLYEQDKLCYMEMQLARGTLRNLIKERTPFTTAEKMWFLFEVLYTLDVARAELGFLHGDLHPGNLFYVFAEPRTYYIGGEYDLTVECKSLFRPLLGDFGTSHLNVKEVARFNLDLELLWESMEEWGLRKPVRRSEKLQERIEKDGDYVRLLGWLYYQIKAQENTMEGL